MDDALERSQQLLHHLQRIATARGVRRGGIRKTAGPVVPKRFGRLVVEGKRLSVQNLAPLFKSHERLHQSKPADTVKKFGSFPICEILFRRHQIGDAGHRITVATLRPKHMQQKNLVVYVAQFRVTRIGGHVFAFLGGRRQECLHRFVEHADLSINMARHVEHMRDIGCQRGITVGNG